MSTIYILRKESGIWNIQNINTSCFLNKIVNSFNMQNECLNEFLHRELWRSQTFWCHCQPPKDFCTEKKNKAKPKKNRKALFGTDRNEMVCVFGYKGMRATSPKNIKHFSSNIAEKEN